jgi:GNAT superfamily N-acetyltransferase
MGRLIGHLLETDPDRAWLVEAKGTVAFGVAVQRQSFSFLSFLFVRPELQGKGIGRELLGRCMPDGGPATTPRGAFRDAGRDAHDGPVRGTCVDALQPISTGLYADAGIVPRVPLFSLIGRPERSRVNAPRSPGAAPPVAGTPFDARDQNSEEVDSLDRETVGFVRPDDHRFWQHEGRRCVLYRGHDGEPLGYGYVQPSGRVGPIALRDPSLAVPVLGDLMRRVRPPGAWQVVVPGTAADPLMALLRAGLRFEGSPALYCASRASIDFERYLPAGFALI